MENGRILRGRATAGQLGHIPVDPAGPPCLCGRRGCVEPLSSGTALGGLIRAAGLPEGTTAADADRAGASRRRPRRSSVLAAWAGPLRRAADSLVATLDCERIILGGGLGREAAEAIALLPAEPSWYRDGDRRRRNSATTPAWSGRASPRSTTARGAGGW